MRFTSSLRLALAAALSLASSVFAVAQINQPAQFTTARSVTTDPGFPLYGVADFNGDGRPDMLTESFTSGVVAATVLLQNANGSFTAKASTSIPLSVTKTVQVADVNGDGRADIVVASPSPADDNGNPAGPSMLNVYLGNGDGTFRAPVTVALISDTAIPRMLIHDLNGDKKPDIAILSGHVAADGSYVYGTLQTFLNQGSGTFHAGPIYPASVGALLAADSFHKDGHVDLVVSSGTNGNLQILNGKGDGSFTAGTTYSSIAPSLASADDFNRDGNQDLVAIDRNTNKTSILLGNGDGTFKVAGTLNAAIPGIYNARGITINDFNHDGYPDIAIAYTSLTGVVAIFNNNGNGSFASPHVYNAGTNGLGSVGLGIAAADFNRDGNLDLVTDRYPFEVTFGDGRGNFAAPTITESAKAGSIASGDFNRDGKQDIAIVNQAACTTCHASVTVYTGSGKGYLNTGKTYAVPMFNGAVTVGDVNGDGKLDLVVTRINPVSSSATDDTSVLLGNGDGTFQTARNYHLVGAPANGSDTTNTQTYLVDVNHDHRLDLVGDWGVALGNGNGTFQTPISFPEPVKAIAAIVVADFNHDGNPDVAIAQSGFVKSASGQPVLYTLLGNGKGSFNIAHQENLSYNSFPTFLSLTTADLNKDGKPDLIYVIEGHNNSNVFFNNMVVEFGKGTGFFAAPVTYSLPVFFSPATVVTADFNRDGYTDVLLFAPFKTGDSLLYRGGAGGKLTMSSPYYDGAVSSAIVLDLNSDGALDVVGTTTSGVSRMLNTGNRK